MTNRVVWIVAAAISGTLFASEMQFDFMGGPVPPLPGYPGFWRNRDVQGEIKVLVRFREDGSADSVSLKSSALTAQWEEAKWARLEDEVFSSVEEYLLQWKTAITPMPPQEVTIVYRIDPSLPDRQMNYLLTYGRFDLYKRIEIVAAPPDR